jgi:DNA polymerase-3 subunit beta
MKFTILKENLAKGLNFVEKICGRNLVLPILNNVLLSTEKSFLKLTTTNLEIAITFWCLAKIEKEGEITVPVKVLSNFVALLENQKLNVELKNKILHIEGENYKTQLKGIDSKDFPIIPKIEKNEWIELNAFPFCEGISQVIDFSSPTQTRPELSGVYLRLLKDQVKIVATDSFRLAEKTLYFEKPQNLEEEKSFILPRGAAREIINLFSDVSGKIKLFFSPNQVMFESYFEEIENPQTQLISRLIEGEFPNYQEIIPKGYKTQLILDKKKFLNGIKTASLFSGTGNEVNLSIEPKKGIVEIFAQNTEIGQTNIEVPAKVKGEKVKTCFNYRFLIEGISKIKSAEFIFELNQEGGPGVIRPKDNQDFIYILMPIKQG